MKISLVILLHLIFFNTLLAQVGKVGINTTTPLALLHVKDSSVLFSAPPSLPVTPGLPPVSGVGNRMMWYADKAALRAGRVAGLHWDKDSIGNYSAAMGISTKAIGFASTALGNVSTASGSVSTAMGSETIASGINSTAIGNKAKASGPNSFSMGSFTESQGNSSFAGGSLAIASGASSIGMGESIIASGNYSSSFGFGNTASGSASSAFGNQNTASGYSSIAIGYNTLASGDKSFASGDFTEASGLASFATGFSTDAIGTQSFTAGFGSTASGLRSVAMGYITNARGDYSTALGYTGLASGEKSFKATGEAYAAAFNSMAIGRYNDTITGCSPTTWVDTDPLFSIGNGAGFNARSNAMTVLKNGRTGINTANPKAMLHLLRGNTVNGPIHSSASAVIEADLNNSFLQFSTANNAQSGLLAGNEDLSIRSAFIFTADSAINLRTGGNNTRMSITKDGNTNFSGEVRRTPTGSANVVPICYGSIDAAGTILSGTGNFTVNLTVTGIYEISITDETYSNTGYISNITPVNFNPRFVSTATSAGKLVVRLFSSAGTLTDTAFQFTVFKP